MRILLHVVLTVLGERCEKAEQLASRNCLEFVNLPINPNESTNDSVVNFVSQKMNININSNDIDYSYIKTRKKNK